jgi:predicted nucleic acid-binding protein
LILYLDTSAVAKLVADEAESRALANYLETRKAAGDTLVSSILVTTELHRMATRLGLDHVIVSDVIDQMSIASADDALLLTAALLPGSDLRTLDALHLATATALAVGADEVVSYDHRQIAGAPCGRTTDHRPRLVTQRARRNQAVPRRVLYP